MVYIYIWYVPNKYICFFEILSSKYTYVGKIASRKNIKNYSELSNFTVYLPILNYIKRLTKC